MAPMANVTDSVFRKLIAAYGKPDVMWTEFVSADGLISAGRTKLLHDLVFSSKERPIVAQLFTGRPEAMRKAAELVRKLGFDGLDINMGCPDRTVERQGGGAAHMKDMKNALAVIEAARVGVGRAEPAPGVGKDSRIKKHAGSRRQIPISVKTRIGYNKVDLAWIRFLLEQNLPALTVHLRTRKEMSDVPAHWELMPEIVKLRDQIQAGVNPDERTLIIGNGDVESVEQGRELIAKSGCDGIMIGRGIFGKPWLFNGLRRPAEYSLLPVSKSVGFSDSFSNPSVGMSLAFADRLKILLQHTKLFEQTFCPPGKNGKPIQSKRIKNFAVMKKHFKAYVSGWDGAKELRVELMECDSAKETAAVIKCYLDRAPVFATR